MGSRDCPTPTPTPTPATACQWPMTIDHTKVPSTQSNFTVLVSLTDPRSRCVYAWSRSHANGSTSGSMPTAGDQAQVGSGEDPWHDREIDRLGQESPSVSRTNRYGLLPDWMEIARSRQTNLIPLQHLGNLSSKAVWTAMASTPSLSDSTSNAKSLQSA